MVPELQETWPDGVAVPSTAGEQQQQFVCRQGRQPQAGRQERQGAGVLENVWCMGLWWLTVLYMHEKCCALRL